MLNMQIKNNIATTTSPISTTTTLATSTVTVLTSTTTTSTTTISTIKTAAASIAATTSTTIGGSQQQQLFFEGCGREGNIRCIFLMKFYPVAGSKIRCQVPENYVSKEIFDAIRVYIMPKQLHRSVMTINVLGFKIVGYPVRIDSQKYARNALIFNLCFVCDSWARSNQYEQVVKKLSDYLIMMEEETGFISHDDNDKYQLKRLFEKVMYDLNNYKVTTILEKENTINLKIVSPQIDPINVMDHMVPLLLSQYKTIPLDNWDLTTQQILPYINGINHIAKIASNADVDMNLVKNCIQNLNYYNVVELLPILKYSNVYMCTPNLNNLSKCPMLYQACKKYVCVKLDHNRPSLQKIFQFYSSMTHGITLRSICQRLCPQNNNIDERKLVIFGLQHKFIRCIHKYPIFTGTVPIGRQKLYTGLYNFDEICCKLGVPLSSIENDIDLDPNISVIWK